jgi:Family of unknown function (DUF6152)
MPKLRYFTAMLVVCAFAQAPAWSHHSRAVYDLTRFVKLEGSVLDWQWTAPHSSLQLSVPDGKGGAAIWDLEGGSPSLLFRYGWRRTDVNIGDKVTVMIRPLRSGALGGSLSQLTTASGVVRGSLDSPNGQKRVRAEDEDVKP